MASLVSAIYTKPGTVVEDYGKLMDMAEYRKALNPELETLLKLNLSWTYFFPACSTPPWELEGVAAKLQKDGFGKIIPVENETVVTKPVEGARQNKWLSVLEKYGLKFTPLTDVEWKIYAPKSRMLALGDIFPGGVEIPAMFPGKSVVHLPTLKCHGHTTMTGAMKNAFGGLLRKKRHHCHKMIHEVLVDLLAIQKEIHPGIFSVMDGTVAGNGAGPRTMVPEVKNLILASSDQVAIDAIAAKIMGFDPMKIPFIRLAHDAGLGMGDTSQIEVVGADLRNVNFHFKTSKSPVIYFDQFFRRGAVSHLTEKVLFHTPLFGMCIFGSETYHDKVWYPTVGKSLIEKFNRTEWGALFAQYK